MSKSKLTRVLTVGAMLAAMHLAGMTTVALGKESLSGPRGGLRRCRCQSRSSHRYVD
jgi:hypothetical protein